ncbi:hypothetical protein EK21DRAFT_115766 [Setomelanomma holmii]|uniref:Uncharacterized protein n=1 Tax=Setomelanomma holmii TaxID=210430 RepID=A0A9P4LH87_9PLEO|nr:hypothetical protein EK21DRAFT_115766 [Setomelanomma holmii]
MFVLTQRYIEFGDALHGLHSNLNTIETIIKAANTSLASDRFGTLGPLKFHTKTLIEIIGNFKLTLEESRDFLNDGTKFRQKQGVTTNVLYNINVDPQATHLINRLAFHSTKVGLILDAFNIHAQTHLRDLSNEHHQDTAEVLQELKHLINGQDPAGDVIPVYIARDLTVAPELIEKFTSELRNRAVWATTSPETAKMKMLLYVKDGHDTFFNHFNNMSQMTDSTSYLRLMKSI